MEPGDFFCISLCIVPFLAPARAGFQLLAEGSDDDLTRMAGLLTLKPLLTTPLWIAIAAILGDPYQYRSSVLIFMPAVVAILPGACLTLVAAIRFRSTLSGPWAGKARLLLALDCVRWFNSLLFGTASAGIEPLQLLYLVTIPLGLAMPSIFASVAQQVVTSDAVHR